MCLGVFNKPITFFFIVHLSFFILFLSFSFFLILSFLFFLGYFFIFLFHHVLFNFIISIELMVNQFLYFLLYNKSFLAFFLFKSHHLI